MMCLAEALLRIPDAHTADELIADKLAGPDWSEKLGRSDSSFVNAATFSLLLTGKVLEGAQDRSDNWKAALGRAVGRLGEPVVRTAVREAMKILGRNFVFGRTIDEAMQRAEPERAAGAQPQLRHARRGGARRSRTRSATPRPIAARSTASPRRRKGGFRKSPGISVKLTALHPRFEFAHAEEAVAAILPVLRELALKASQGRRPFHHRCRGSRPARAADGRVRGAARRRCAVRQRLGRVRARDPGLSEARRAAVRLGDRGGARRTAAS